MKINAVLESKKEDTGDQYTVVSLEDAKNWCKIELDIDEEDDLIESLISTAVKQAEGYLNISLVPKNLTAIINNGLGGQELPYGPVQSITSVTDCENNALAVDDGYSTDGIDFLGIRTPKYNWLRVEYTTGYTELPQHFKTGVLQQILWLYENRGDQNLAGQMSPMAIQTLKPYRRVW